MIAQFVKLCFSFQLDLDKGHNVVNFVAAYFSSLFFINPSQDSSSFESNSQRSVLIKDIVVRGKIRPNGNKCSESTFKIVELLSCPLLFCLSQNLVSKQMILCHLQKQMNNLQTNRNRNINVIVNLHLMETNKENAVLTVVARSYGLPSDIPYLLVFCKEWQWWLSFRLLLSIMNRNRFHIFSCLQTGLQI